MAVEQECSGGDGEPTSLCSLRLLSWGHTWAGGDPGDSSGFSSLPRVVPVIQQSVGRVMCRHPSLSASPLFPRDQIQGVKSYCLQIHLNQFE